MMLALKSCFFYRSTAKGFSVFGMKPDDGFVQITRSKLFKLLNIVATAIIQREWLVRNLVDPR